MRFSVTERQLYKRCRRKWSYASYNHQSLSPVINSPALDLGTLIHATLAEWTADPTLNPTAYYTDIAIKHADLVAQTYRERIGCDPSPSELQPTNDAIVLGLGMISNYQQRWHSALPAGFTLIDNELSLVQAVKGTEHCTEEIDGICRCNYCCGTAGLPCRGLLSSNCEHCIALHSLECTFDGVMADENGDLYIIERKTFSRTPATEELTNNDQFLAYQWALNQQFPGKVVGLAYDGLLKKLKPPASKTMSDLFIRKLLLRNTAELQEFEQLLALELNEMANPATPIYKNVPWMGCAAWECSYIHLCHATSKGEPTTDLMKMFVRSERKKFLEVETV